MVNLTATDIASLLNLDTGISNETIEKWIDQAIDMINREDIDLPNMTGTAGSKTVNVESKARGVIVEVVWAVYYSFYKGLETSTVGGLTVSTPNLLANSAVREAVKEAAKSLKEIEVSHG